MEKWKKINGYDYYEVSTEGNVRSSFAGKNTVLKPTIHRKTGNRRVKLYNNGKAKTINISTLMADVYLNRNSNERTSHINGLVHDDRLVNLKIG